MENEENHWVRFQQRRKLFQEQLEIRWSRSTPGLNSTRSQPLGINWQTDPIRPLQHNHKIEHIRCFLYFPTFPTCLRK